VVVAYGSIFNKEVLEAPRRGWINIHYSLLPKWPGAAPVQNAILNGETRSGVTIFKLDEGIDTGEVAKQVSVEILENETSGELLSRLTDLGIATLIGVLSDFESGSEDLREQDKDHRSLVAIKPDRKSAKIDWQSSSLQIHNLVRAMNPEPMAWCLLENSPIRVLSSVPSSMRVESESTRLVGEVQVFEKKVLVKCGESSMLELLEVQPAGKKPMRALDWINGMTDRNVVLS
jgi:methionyl-tRNA formyltransferase